MDSDLMTNALLKNNIINFNAIKKQSLKQQRLEMLMHDSMDNIEEFGFQFYLQCDIDSIIDYEILADDLDLSNTCPLTAQA